MKRKVLSVIMAVTLVFGMAGCASFGTDGKEGQGTDAARKEGTNTDASGKGEQGKETEIQVFIAASLNTVMEEISEKYCESHPDVKIVFNADSSGKLLAQIQEGYECDLFFSAAQAQMDDLEAGGLAVEGTRADVLNNQLVVVALKDSGTKVDSLGNIGKAKSIALAGGSVPAGKYTRQALMNLGILKKTEDAASISTQEVSDALGGVEISEQDNVSKVLMAVVEGSCEVGTTYYSDTYGYEDRLEIIEKVSQDLTGDVVYPVCRVVNPEADEAQNEAADDFYEFLLSDEAKTIFASYYFEVF